VILFLLRISKSRKIGGKLQSQVLKYIVRRLPSMRFQQVILMLHSSGFRLLDVNAEATHLAKLLLSGGALPPKASLDALHIAVAAVHDMDYLLTWNCKHIANARMRPIIERIIHQHGYNAPIIATPEELQGA
jgi:hypothetical protein